MALKFLNKKGWHTGSLRNIENVWKAEQKHDAEQKKLEELRKQIQEERERSEFRLLQEQAGLVPKQERLEFLYDSGLSVGKSSSSDGFKALESLPKADNEAACSSSTKEQASVPGALFEEKRQSANDAWRKLHSDPLLMIRQREQEALARVKNNPVQMAMIRRSVEVQKQEKVSNKNELHKKHRQDESKHQKHSPLKHRKKSESNSLKQEKRRNSYQDVRSDVEKHKRQHEEFSEGDQKKARYGSSDPNIGKSEAKDIGRHERFKQSLEVLADPKAAKKENEDRSFSPVILPSQRESCRKHRSTTARLSEEERASRLREMLVDAELHEEQRWKRLRKAEEDDAREAMQTGTTGSKDFLDAAKKSIYGADRGGSSTIEKSVRRRTHYLQGKSDGERNAFRR